MSIEFILGSSQTNPKVQRTIYTVSAASKKLGASPALCGLLFFPFFKQCSNISTNVRETAKSTVLQLELTKYSKTNKVTEMHDFNMSA